MFVMRAFFAAARTQISWKGIQSAPGVITCKTISLIQSNSEPEPLPPPAPDPAVALPDLAPPGPPGPPDAPPPCPVEPGGSGGGGGGRGGMGGGGCERNTP